MASRYFSEIASRLQGEVPKKAIDLGWQYKNVANLLNKARDKNLADGEKIKMLLESKKAEESCIKGIEELLQHL